MTTADSILYLDEATTGWLLNRFDPVDVAAQALEHPPADPRAILIPADRSLTVVVDPAADRVLCLIFSRRFREVCVAGTILALARSLLAGRLPVVCVLGDGRQEGPHVEQLVRSLPGIVHVIVCRAGPVLVSPARPLRVHRGVTVTVTSSVREALEGADLVLIVSPPARLDPRWLAPDTVVLDATGAVDLARLGTEQCHTVSEAELAAVATGVATAAYRAALRHVVGVRLQR